MTFAVEGGATESYSKLRSVTEALFPVIGVTSKAEKIDEDGIRNTVSVARDTVTQRRRRPEPRKTEVKATRLTLHKKMRT